MNRFLALLAMLALFPATLFGAQTVNRIVAVVNTDIITQYQIEQELEKRQMGAEAQALMAPEQLSELRQRALNSLIEETLVQQRVKELGLEVSQEEIEAAIGDVLLQNQLTREELIEALSLQGMEFDAYQEKLREQILRFKLLGREVKSKVDVTQQELLDYFREHIEDYRQKPMVHLARITFPLPERPSGEEVEAVRARAREAQERVRGGEDFLALLADYSGDGRAQGGDMGRFAEEELTAAFAEAVKGLTTGEVSEPVETPEAFHLFKVLERDTGSVRQFDAVKDEIAKTLTEQKTDGAFKSWAEGLRKSARIDIRE